MRNLVVFLAMLGGSAAVANTLAPEDFYTCKYTAADLGESVGVIYTNNILQHGLGTGDVSQLGLPPPVFVGEPMDANVYFYRLSSGNKRLMLQLLDRQDSSLMRAKIIDVGAPVPTVELSREGVVHRLTCSIGLNY